MNFNELSMVSPSYSMVIPSMRQSSSPHGLIDLSILSNSSSLMSSRQNSTASGIWSKVSKNLFSTKYDHRASYTFITIYYPFIT